MIVGPTGSGKSCCYKILAHAMTKLRESNHSDPKYQAIRYKILNPKSITMGELYGEEDRDTKEWSDGLASKIIRKGAKDEKPRINWCVFDGPVDALWIENMNTVLDDNMMLCLANGERIKLKEKQRMLFEVQDLAVRASLVLIEPRVEFVLEALQCSFAWRGECLGARLLALEVGE